jgi:hypothetical protein
MVSNDFGAKITLFMDMGRMKITFNPKGVGDYYHNLP